MSEMNFDTLFPWTAALTRTWAATFSSSDIVTFFIF